MDEIEVLRQAQERNYAHARDLLGDKATLPQDFVLLYEQLGSLMMDERKATPKNVAIAQFLMVCRHQLTLASLNALRGRLSDAYFYTRRAIEAVASARKVQRNSRLAKIWMESVKGAGAYYKYRHQFKPRGLFPQDHPLLNRLAERYDHASRYLHPSYVAFSDHLGHSEHDDRMDLTLDYLQLRDNEPWEPMRTLLWTCETHLGIIQMFEEILLAEQESLGDDWDTAKERAILRLDSESKSWRQAYRRNIHE